METAAVKEFFTVKDIQQIMNLTRSTAYVLVNSQVFPVIRIGRVIRVSREAFELWLSNAASPNNPKGDRI